MEKPNKQLTVPELKKKLDKLNIEYTEDAKKADLLEALENATEDKPKSTANKGKDIYYLFKSKTYIDDDPKETTILVEAGLYKVDKVLPRYEKVKTPDVVKIEGRPKDMFIAEYAKSLGVTLETGQEIDFDELLEKLTQEWSF